MDNIEKIIRHHGIKGMRWGVRRKRGKDGRVSQDYKTSRGILKKKTKQMSNEELRKLNKRLELERKLSQVDPRASATGKRKVGQFMNTYSNMAISAVAGAAITLTVGRAIEKKL